MKQQLEQILASAQKELSECGDLKVMEELRVKFLGKRASLPPYSSRWADFPQRKDPLSVSLQTR